MRTEMIDITAAVADAVADAPRDAAFCLVFVPHTTAAVTINENADADVPRDILAKLNAVFPQTDAYRHSEGNSDAHIKASLVGPSVLLPLRNGRPALGQWQGIFFCEFDGPRRRQVWITIR
jgi:secondary thiamine-phosphate synthase enzyme